MPAILLPPLNTPNLTAIERETLRVAHTLHAPDAATALGLKRDAYKLRMQRIWIKFWNQESISEANRAGGSPSFGGLLNAGFIRRGRRGR